MTELPEGQMYFSLKDMERYLNISISTLHRWRKDGVYIAQKVGTGWRVHRNEVERLVRRQTPQPVQTITESWSQVERQQMVEIIEEQILRLARTTQTQTQIRTLLEGFTPEELQDYCSLLESVLTMSREVLSSHEQQPHQ